MTALVEHQPGEAGQGRHLDLISDQPSAPQVFRGLAADWPAVQAALAGYPALFDYLGRFAADEDVMVFRSEAAEGGRLFYNRDFTGFNFTRLSRRMPALLESFAAAVHESDGTRHYVGSTPVDRCLPGFRRDNDLALGGRAAVKSLWMGSPSSVAAHFDFPDNIACVVAGSRRFTLFPPEQLPNLYVGPLDLTPAGQPISLVDINRPDLERFPKFAEALATATTVELEPGDALYLPSLWWHAVDAGEPFNLLINYWWQPDGARLGSPFYVLLQAILAVGGLPEEQRRHWQGLFDHYAFSATGLDPEHIPPAGRGLLGDLDRRTLANIKANLRDRVNRQLG